MSIYAISCDQKLGISCLSVLIMSIVQTDFLLTIDTQGGITNNLNLGLV